MENQNLNSGIIEGSIQAKPEVWRPTPQIRWKKKTVVSADGETSEIILVLEQTWIDVFTAKTEWREIPIEEN